MTQQIKAMSLALEVLEKLRGFHAFHNKSCEAEITALRQAIEQAQKPEGHQEPVAWMYESVCGNDFTTGNYPPSYAKNIRPLYTSPPQRQPLTITEIREGRDTADPSGEDVCAWSFAKGVQWAETKHGITGEQK